MIRFTALLAFAAALASAQSADRKQPGPLNEAFYGSWHMQGSAQTESSSMLSFIARGDSIEANTNGRTYSFKIDGREYPSGAPGEMTMWKRTGDRAYEATQKANNQVVSVTSVQIAEDGKSLRFQITPKDGAAKAPVTMERAQGATTSTEPLIGFWKLVTASGGKVFEPAGNGVRVTSSAGDSYTASFDGADAPLTGQTVPAGSTVSLKLLNDHSFEETRKTVGKSVGVVRFELSPDGQTLTQTVTGTDGGTPAATTWTKK